VRRERVLRYASAVRARGSIGDERYTWRRHAHGEAAPGREARRDFGSREIMQALLSQVRGSTTEHTEAQSSDPYWTKRRTRREGATSSPAALGLARRPTRRRRLRRTGQLARLYSAFFVPKSADCPQSTSTAAVSTAPLQTANAAEFVETPQKAKSRRARLQHTPTATGHSDIQSPVRPILIANCVARCLT
jgi:hypothetical protein